jgi:hypothetical protein
MRYIALVLALGALVFASNAVAAKPEMERVEVDESETIDCGGYEITHSVTGFIIFREFFRNGEFVGAVTTYSLTESFTGPGGTLVTPDVGIDHLRVEEDGSATLAVIGIVSRFVVPGEGLVFGEVGQLRLFFTEPGDPEPDVTFEAGHHDGDVVEAACELLAP